MVKDIPYNALPKGVRERLRDIFAGEDPIDPIHADRGGQTWGLLWLALGALCCFGAVPALWMWRSPP